MVTQPRFRPVSTAVSAPGTALARVISKPSTRTLVLGRQIATAIPAALGGLGRVGLAAELRENARIEGGVEIDAALLPQAGGDDRWHLKCVAPFERLALVLEGPAGRDADGVGHA